MRPEYWLTSRQLEERRVLESNRQAKIERAVRDMKDLAGVAYMGKNE